MIIVRDINFGFAFADCARNLEGQGWPHHKLLKHFSGFDLSEVTDIYKTMTVDPRMPQPHEKGMGRGNLVLDSVTLQPKEFPPDCIRIDHIRDRVANSVGLSNPGVEETLARGEVQKKEKPAILSYMPVGPTREIRLNQTRECVRIIKPHIPNFRAPVGLKINVSCPNTEEDLDELLGETESHGKIAADSGIPLFAKFDVTASVPFLKRLAQTKLFDGYIIPNSLGHGKLPERVNWKKYDYLCRPLLKKYGSCGLSFRLNFELAKELVCQLRYAGVSIPIIVGAVGSVKDVWDVKLAGGDAVAFARMTITRWWRPRKVVRAAKEAFGG